MALRRTYCSVVAFCLCILLCMTAWYTMHEEFTIGNDGIESAAINNKAAGKDTLHNNSTNGNDGKTSAGNNTRNHWNDWKYGDHAAMDHTAMERNVLRIAVYEHFCNRAQKWMPHDALDHCPGGEHRKCEFVDYNAQMPPSDALLVHILAMLTNCKVPMPSRSHPRQKWIMFSHESQQRCTIHPRYLHVFHATASIMPYSQIPVRLGNVSKHTTPLINPRPPMNQTEFHKKRNVAWLVSHCNSPSGRDAYVKELAKHIDVAIYGYCGKTKKYCNSEECLNMERYFRFYLAFENSVCAGYVTEKLYRTLASHMIPIVYGMYDYKYYLPKNSVIDVRDFQSPKHLADYLHKVANDKELYESYFVWKDQYEASEHHHDKTYLRNGACEICDYLHRTQKEELKTIDLDALWNTKSYCIPKEQFWKIVGLPHGA